MLEARGDSQYRERVERYYRYCRDNDLALAVAQTDVKGDRSRWARPRRSILITMCEL